MQIKKYLHSKEFFDVFRNDQVRSNLRSLVRYSIPEGSVLLKNDDNVLPLNKKDNVAIFGRSQLKIYKSGTGSGGSVNLFYDDNLIEAIEENNKVAKDTKEGEYIAINFDKQLLETYKEWIKSNPYDDGKGLWANEPFSQVEMKLDENFVKVLSKRNNKAIVILSRKSGEDKDNLAVPGSYYLSEIEKSNLTLINKYFKNVVVIFNVSNYMDVYEVSEFENVKSILCVYQGGEETASGIVDVLTTTSPSGKLIDTLSKDLSYYPASRDFGNKDVYYNEDIYVGYRYFNTFKKDEILYPFGFGLSYSTFKVTLLESKLCKEFNKINLSIEVKNTGKFNAKETVQIYVSKKTQNLDNPEVELVSFLKTKELKPSEKEVLTFSLDIETVCQSYSEKLHSYIIDKGQFDFYYGVDSLNLTKMSNVTFNNSDIKTIKKSTNSLMPGKEFEIFNNSNGTLIKKKVLTKNFSLKDKIAKSLNSNEFKDKYDIKYTGYKGYKLIDVRNNKVSLKEFVGQFEDDELISLVRGEGMCSPKGVLGTASIFGGVTETLIRKYGIPVLSCSDGPSGIRMDVGTKASLLPIGTLLASTFNLELVEELYSYLGKEMELNNIPVLLGPGLNIHRFPLNGRNFEYFSEDPYLSGMMASSVNLGLKKSNRFATIKHFACNSQETDRNYFNAHVSERALRELYLKPFEIAVKVGKVKSIMTGYNLINGYYCASNYDLTTSILRDDYGFDGIVMTDWWAKVNDCENGQNEGNIQQINNMVRSQNDLYMCCDNFKASLNGNNDNLKETLNTSKLTREELIRCCLNILNFIVESKFDLTVNDVCKEYKPSLIRAMIYIDNVTEYHKTVKNDGYYNIYVKMKLNEVIKKNPLSQAVSKLMINDVFEHNLINSFDLNLQQCNNDISTEVTKFITKVKLDKGNYTFFTQPIKEGIDVIDIILENTK